MKSGRVGILSKVIILGLVVYAAITLADLRGKIKSVEENQQTLQEEADALAQENDEAAYMLENSGDSKVIEDIAREKLGLVMPGEKIFYGSNG